MSVTGIFLNPGRLIRGSFTVSEPAMHRIFQTMDGLAPSVTGVASSIPSPRPSEKTFEAFDTGNSVAGASLKLGIPCPHARQATRKTKRIIRIHWPFRSFIYAVRAMPSEAGDMPMRQRVALVSATATSASSHPIVFYDIQFAELPVCTDDQKHDQNRYGRDRRGDQGDSNPSVIGPEIGPNPYRVPCRETQYSQ